MKPIVITGVVTAVRPGGPPRFIDTVTVSALPLSLGASFKIRVGCESRTPELGERFTITLAELRA